MRTDFSSVSFLSVESETAAPLNWPTKKSDLTARFSKPRELGRGGFGQVYRVSDDWLHLDVAVKISTSQDRLVNEVQRLRNLPKQYYVQTFDYGRQKDIAYYSMELLLKRDGWYSLDEFDGVMERASIFPRERVLFAFLVVQQICYGMTFLHNGDQTNTRYFHGDLKPQNVFFNWDAMCSWRSERGHQDTPLVKIIDLGVSRKVGEAAGGFTKRYAPPEQIAGRRCREAVDTFSIGRILLYLLGEIEAAEQAVGTRLQNRLIKKFGTRLSKDAMSILKRSLHSSPSQRTSCEAIGDRLIEFFDTEYQQPVWRIISELSKCDDPMKRSDLTKRVEDHLLKAWGRVRRSARLRSEAKRYIDYAIRDRLIMVAGRGMLRLA